MGGHFSEYDGDKTRVFLWTQEANPWLTGAVWMLPPFRPRATQGRHAAAQPTNPSARTIGSKALKRRQTSSLRS